MKQSIRDYADTLYEGAQRQSSVDANRAKVDFQQKQAARALGYRILSGVDVQKVAGIFADHVGRCVQARFDGYQKAYNEDESFPSAEDFSEILEECKRVRTQQISHVVTATREFIAANGGGVSGGFIPNESTFDTESAEYMDSVVHDWKAWKAKAQLKSGTKKIEASSEKHQDVLLPIYSRAAFDKDLNHQIANFNNETPLSLLFMDLDKFKQINDGPGGHAAGDRALKTFAEAVLKASQHKGLVYRYGGDELCVLLPNHSLDEAGAVGERIRQAVRAIRTNELTDGLNTSIGAACVPESTTDSTKLCEVADAAMYSSKKAGGNRVSKAQSAVTAK